MGLSKMDLIVSSLRSIPFHWDCRFGSKNWNRIWTPILKSIFANGKMARGRGRGGAAGRGTAQTAPKQAPVAPPQPAERKSYPCAQDGPCANVTIHTADLGWVDLGQNRVGRDQSTRCRHKRGEVG